VEGKGLDRVQPEKKEWAFKIKELWGENLCKMERLVILEKEIKRGEEGEHNSSIKLEQKI